MKKVVNVAEIADKSWNFIEDYYSYNNIEWLYYSANPQNKIEQIIKRPKIGRYRACFQATTSLGNNDIVISHMPRMTHWQSIFMQKLKHNNPHLAFSFNFTKLPGEYYRSAMMKSFKRVDRFVVYSSYERNLYSDYFNIPQEKIDMLYWAMDTPNSVKIDTPFNNDYYCAVGGEGRDYATLINVFKKLKDIYLIIVTRPEAIKDEQIPPNVKVYYNLTNQEFWGVVKNSKTVIIPLLDDETSCGHITLVGAMKFRKPIITTFSHGTTDYVKNNINGLVVPSRDTESLKSAINKIESEPDLRENFAEYNDNFAREHCGLKTWANYVHRFIDNYDNIKE